MSANKHAVEDIVWGVRAAEGEAWVYFVQSKSRAGVQHRVDVLDFDGNGSCTCENFLQYGLEAKLRHGARPSHQTTCEHIRRANAYFCLVVKRTIIAKRNERKEPEKEIL